MPTKVTPPPVVRPEPAGAPPRLQEGLAGPASLAEQARTRRGALIVGTIVLAAIAYGVARETVGELPARSLAVVVIAAVFWATEALPLFATAFVVVGLQILLLASDGGLAREATMLLRLLGSAVEVDAPAPIGAAAFLAPLASDIIVLFLGSFLLSAAARKHGLDQVLAHRVLKPFTGSPLRIVYGVLGVTAFFSMWMSNTATAAVMIAIVGPLVRYLPPGAPLRYAVLLAVPFGANIGGIGTPIGSPPNAIAFGVLNQAGYDVTFLTWMLVAVPLECMLLGITGALLHVMFRSKPGAQLPTLEAPGALSPSGRVTLIVMLVTILLWITSGAHGLRPGAVALLASAALTAFGLLDREDVDSIDWNILILMWGALSLSTGAEVSGLMAQVAGVDVGALPGGAWTVALAVAVLAVGLSTVMSNTATAALLVPAAMALSVPGQEQFAMLAALGCSFAMALPVSTPPNTIAYATGDIPLPIMVRTGSVISVVSLVLMLLGYRLVLPVAF